MTIPILCPMHRLRDLLDGEALTKEMNHCGFFMNTPHDAAQFYSNYSA